MLGESVGMLMSLSTKLAHLVEQRSIDHSNQGTYHAEDNADGLPAHSAPLEIAIGP